MIAIWDLLTGIVWGCPNLTEDEALATATFWNNGHYFGYIAIILTPAEEREVLADLEADDPWEADE